MQTDPYNPTPPGEFAPYAYDTSLHPAAKLAWTVRLLIYLALAMVFIAGGPLLKTMAVVGLVASVLTDIDGFVRHVVRVLTLGLALWAASTFGEIVDAFVQLAVGAHGLFGISLGTFVTAVVVFAIGTALTFKFVRQFQKSKWARGLNRVCGAVIGAAEGMILVVALFWSASAFEGPINKIATDEQYEKISSLIRQPIAALKAWQESMQEDPTSAWLEKNNYLLSIPVVATAQAIAEIAMDGDALNAIIYSKDIEQLLKHPDFATYYEELKKDPLAKWAIKRRNVRALIRTPKFRELIAKPKVKAAIRRRLPEIKEALFRTGNQVVQKAARSLDDKAVDHLPEMAKTVAATMSDIPIDFDGKVKREQETIDKPSQQTD